MRPPSKKEAAGFDIVVWSDDEGDVVARAFTPAGDRALKAFVNKYEKGAIVIIYCHPEEFQQEIPKGTIVGLLSPRAKKVVPMSKNPLH